MPRLFLRLLILLLLLSQRVSAQHLPGVAMGNYAGTQALYHNPAFVADSRYSVYVNLLGTQAYLANNHVKYNAPYSFLSLITNSVPTKYRNEKGAIVLPSTDLDQKMNGNPKHLNLGIEARGPAVMVSLLDGKVGFGLSSRVRTLLNLTHTSEPIAQALTTRGKGLDIQQQLYENQAATLHINGVGELAFTVGGVLLDNETEFFKVGITAKRLLGLYNAHILINESSFEILPDATYANEKELIQLPTINTRYGYTNDQAITNIRPTSPAWLLGDASAGSGWGLDVGMVYEYRPQIHRYSYTEKAVLKRDGSKNKYLYRVSVALTDVGRVRFKNPNYVRAFTATTTNRTLNYDQFSNLGSTQGFFNAVNQSLLTDTTSRSTSFRSVLPTALQASIEYQIRSNVYVNTLWVQNLISAKAFGMKGESVLAVTPRYEHRWYEISVPVSLMNRYGSLGIGLAGRVGPVWFGTDHLTGLLNIGKPKVFNLYAGVSAGLFRRPPRSPNPCFRPGGETFWQRLFQRRY